MLRPRASLRHIFFVAFDAGLVEGVDSQKVGAVGTGFLEEVVEVAEGVGADFAELQMQTGNITFAVGFYRALKGDAIECFDTLSVLGVAKVSKGRGQLVNTQESFKDLTLALLQILSKGMEVGGIAQADGEEPLAFFSFAFPKELFPPFGQVVQTGLKGGQGFDADVLGVEGVTQECIARSKVVGSVEVVLGLSGPFKKLLNVHPHDRHREESYGGKHRIATSDVFGDGIALVAGCFCEWAQTALLGVGGDDDALLELFGAVAFFHVVMEELEGDAGFEGTSRFGHHVESDGAVVQLV